MARKRKHQPTGIQRYARYAIAGTATAGLLLSIGCIAKGSSPLNGSAYAQFGPVSLPLLGALAYALVAALAVAPTVTKNKNLEGPTWLGLFIGSTAMTIFSGYLLYVMFGVLQETCVPCILSAVLSLGLWILTLTDNHRKSLGQLLLPGVSVAAIALVSTAGLYAYAQNPDSFVAGNPPPAVETSSGAAEIALAKHLSDIGAKKYGAWWCPHCHSQQTLFGKEAFDQVTYIECDEEGINPQPQACQAAGVRSYPTWEINGQTYSGVQPLQQLANISGYDGPTDFINQPAPQ